VERVERNGAQRREEDSMETAQAQKRIVKLSANLPGDVADALVELADRRNTSKTEILRHAISLEKWLQDELDRGSRFLLEQNGKLREIIFRF
jgi:predicted transcriptional regulator